MRITADEYKALIEGKKKPAVVKLAISTLVEKGKRVKVPNKTEEAAIKALSLEFPGCKVKFEQVTFHLDNGHAYTPDVVVWGDQFRGGALFVEVKNAAYKHASYGRSRMAFDQCKIEHDIFAWRWMELTKNGWKRK